MKHLHFYWGDWLIYGCVVGIALLSFLLANSIFSSSVDTDTQLFVTIQTDTAFHQYALHENAEIEISNAEHHLILKIMDGSAYIEESDCSDKICVAQGKISRPGQTIVCLPARVVITIEGDAADADIVLG